MPFAGTDTCVVWYLDEHFSVEEFFKGTPQFHKKGTPKPLPVFYKKGGWARYDDDVNMLMNFLKPPLLFYCALPANGTTELLCAFRSPSANMLTMTAKCELEGRCSSYPQPPSAPPHPASAPLPGKDALSVYCSQLENSQACVVVTLLSPFMLVGMVVALLLFCCVGSRIARSHHFWRRYMRRYMADDRRDSNERGSGSSLTVLPGEAAISAPSPATSAATPTRASDRLLGPHQLSSEACMDAGEPRDAHASVGGGVASMPRALVWQDLTYRVGRRRLLQPSSACIDGGLWCLLGPSGCGKSTILGVLSGRKRTSGGHHSGGGKYVGGDVFVHGQRASPSARRGCMGYVTQDDILPGTSTVREHLSFHVCLRAPWLSEGARHTLVLKGLRSVGLLPKANCCIGDGYVRGLSGGERRRVSVCVELIVAAARAEREQGGEAASVPILLMDEPFSGLDSLNARLLLNALVSVCETGRMRLGSPTSSPVRTAAAAAGQFEEHADEGGLTVTPTGQQQDAPHDAHDASCNVPAGAPAGHGDQASSASGGSVGACVLMSVHQPTENFMRKMSGGLVIAPGGRLLYSGPVRDACGRCQLTPAFEAVFGNIRELSPNVAEAIIELVLPADPETEQHIGKLYADLAESSSREVAGLQGRWPLSLRAPRDRASMWAQVVALGRRHAALLVRHPQLAWANLMTSICVACTCAWAFNGVDMTLKGGLQQRMGLLFVIGMHSLLAGLASIGTWRHDKLIFFHERGVGCYSTLPYMLSRTFVADALPLRIIPALAMAAIVYPTAGFAGLHHDDSSSQQPEHELDFGFKKAGMLMISLCLLNLVASAMFSCIAIVFQSTPVAVLIGVLYALFSLLFSGFLANANVLPDWLSFMPYFSCLRYTFELAISNELLSKTITVHQMFAEDKGKTKLVLGDLIIRDKLGYDRFAYETYDGFCPWGGPTLYEHDGSTLNVYGACWFDLYVPAVWFVVAFGVSVLLLAYCVRDPH